MLASAGAAALVLFALKDNVLYFYSPSDVQTKHVAAGVAFRIGGLVAPHSVHHGAGADVSFTVTRRQGRDSRSPITACCRRCSAKGRASSRWARSTTRGTFAATEVLAKHDERYMPPEVVDALKRSGRWKEGQ